MSTKAKKFSLQDYLFIATVLLGAFLSSLTETIMNNALPTIMTAFSVSQDTAQWLSTGYILVVGIMMPATAYFMDRFNLRSLFIGTFSLFLAATLLAGLAPNFQLLFIGRMLQAVSVGVSMPVASNVLMLIFPKAQRVMAMGLSGVVVILGPALGPTLAGWILKTHSWRMLFHMISPIAAAVVICALFFVHNITQTKPVKLDWLSLLLSTVGLGALLYGFSSFGTWMAYLLIMIGLIVLAVFTKRQLSTTQPFLELRVFKSSSFTRTTILAALVSVVMLGAELLIPLYVQNVHQGSALTSGLIMLPGAVAMMLMSPISGHLFDKYGIKGLTLIGFIITIVATIPMIFFNTQTSYWIISLCYTLRMAGIGLISMQLITSGINALPKELLVHGNSVASTIRQAASSLGTAFIVTLSSVVSKNIDGSHVQTLETGYRWSFVATTAIAILGLLIALRLRNKTTPEFQMKSLNK